MSIGVCDEPGWDMSIGVCDEPGWDGCIWTWDVIVWVESARNPVLNDVTGIAVLRA